MAENNAAVQSQAELNEILRIRRAGCAHHAVRSDGSGCLCNPDVQFLPIHCHTSFP